MYLRRGRRWALIATTSVAPGIVHKQVLERVLGRRQGARLGEVFGVLDFLLDRLRHPVRVRPIEQAGFLEVGSKPRDGIALAAGVDFAARSVALRIALEVPEEADGARLDQAGPLSGARAGDGALHRVR